MRRFGLVVISVCWAVSIAPRLRAQQAAPAEHEAPTNTTVDSSAVSPQVIPPATSRHVVHVAAATIPYVVTWSSTSLQDAAAVPQATISATSYVRDDISDRSARPVMFGFNGGPGASSSPLHFGILGPRRYGETDAKGATTFVDNKETLLDIADLVLIDPVGTGFSRELRPNGGRPYWNPEGDARSVEEFIRNWLRDNGRTTSPVYIVGESYGGYRLARMAKDISDLNIAGLVLVSPGTDMSSDEEQQFVFTLPSMAAAAYAHDRSHADGHSVEQIFDEARSFAQSNYVVALQQGSELPLPDRDRLAQRMAKFIGLPASMIAAANLRVDTQDFLEQLLPGKVVGRIDTRVAAPKPEEPLVAGRPKAADDPALHMGASNLIKSARARDYLRNEVGVKTDLDYISLTLDVNFKFDWNSGSHKLEDRLHNLNATPRLADLMREKPETRLLLLSGYYDLATPLLYQRYALTHAGVPLDRTRMVAFAAGHTVYEGDTRKQVSKELHDFIEKKDLK